MRTLLLTFICVVFAFANNERIAYEGYKIYQIHPKTMREVDFLKGLEKTLTLDFATISKLPNQPVVAMVGPENQEHFEIQLKHGNIKWNILSGDMQRIVEQEQVRQLQASKVQNGKISFTNYHRYAEIQTYLQAISTQNPSIAFQESIGTSFEDREISMLSICKDGCGSKPKIFMECGIHAREWIAPPVCLYVIQELVENPNNSALIENVDWHIVPVMNVDGYEYTHTMSRFWRKTRSLGTNCDGVDANRNFDFHWMEIGASANECSETYAGPEEASEIEVKAIQGIVQVLNHQNQVKLYLAIHSYGQYILHPWGYTGEPSAVEELLAESGKRAAEAIAAYAGTTYTVGSFYDALYPAAGTSVDWAHGVQNIGLAYTVELPMGGSNGFNPPPSRIDPVVRETFEGIKEFHKIVEENYVKK